MMMSTPSPLPSSLPPSFFLFSRVGSTGGMLGFPTVRAGGRLSPGLVRTALQAETLSINIFPSCSSVLFRFSFFSHVRICSLLLLFILLKKNRSTGDDFFFCFSSSFRCFLFFDYFVCACYRSASCVSTGLSCLPGIYLSVCRDAAEKAQ